MSENIEEIITKAVDVAINKAFATGSCTCHLSPDAQKELSHFMGMVKDVGGSFNDGGLVGAKPCRRTMGRGS